MTAKVPKIDIGREREGMIVFKAFPKERKITITTKEKAMKYHFFPRKSIFAFLKNSKAV